MKRILGAMAACAAMAGSAVAEPETRARSLEQDALALTATGAVAIGASLYFGIRAREQARFIENHDVSQPWPADIGNAEVNGQRLEGFSIVTGAIGIGLVSAGAICYWRSRVARREDRVTIAPMASPSTAGIALTGGF